MTCDDLARDPKRDLLDVILEYGAPGPDPALIAAWLRYAPVGVVIRTIRELALVDRLEDYLAGDRMRELLEQRREDRFAELTKRHRKGEVR